MSLDVAALVQPVSSDDPAGPNLEYGPEFQALEEALRGRPETQMGDVIVAAVEPDWASAAEHASRILRASKDLRAATGLARALLALRGVAGFAEGLALIRELLVRYWGELHPALEEGGDASARAIALAAIAHRETISQLHTASLPAESAVRFGDLASAKPRSGLDAAAGWGVPGRERAPLRPIVARCAAAARALEEVWLERAPDAPLDFSTLRQPLDAVLRTVEDTPAAPAPIEATPNVASAAPLERERGPAPLRSRADVLRALDAISEYYLQQEPSSPLPLLVERCKRLVSMSFLDIVEDVFPDGLSHARGLCGRTGINGKGSAI